MNSNKSLIVAVIVVAILAIGSYFVPKGTTVVSTPQTQQLVGSVSSADLYSPYWDVNGVYQYFNAVAMRPATTTLCSILSPGATTSLDFAAFQITTGTSTAATIDMGTSTTAYGTTTNLVSAKSIGSGAQGYAEWYPAGSSNTADDNTIAPNTYLNVKTAGAGVGGYTYGGKCTAVFTKL